MSDRATRTIGDVDRVLVVGDTDRLEDVAVSLTRAFDAATLIRERSADGALARLETADGGVDCLVCGVGRAENDEHGNGKFETLTRLATALPETPILAVLEGIPEDVTHQRDKPNRQERRNDAPRALEAGATDVLRGDESPAVVAARVRTAVDAGRSASRRDDPDQDGRRAESILAHAAAVVCALEPDGTVDAISSAVERRFGHTPDELEGRPLSRVVHSDDRSRLTTTIAEVAASPVGTTAELPARLRRADGAWIRTGLTVTNRLEDPDVDALVVTIGAGEPRATGVDEQDVETALDRLERAVFSIGPDDDLRYWNDAAATLFEASPERGGIVWSVLPQALQYELADRASQARAIDDSVTFRGDDPSGEGRLEVTVAPGAEGLTVLVDRVGPSADGDVETATTAEIDAAERDRENRSLLESAIDALEDGIVVLEDGRVRYANATCSRLTDGDPIVGRRIEDLFDADLAAAVARRAGSTVVRWMDPLEGTFTVGDRHPTVEVFVAPLPAADRTLCVVRDRRRSGESALRVLDRAIADVRVAPSQPAIRETVLEGVLESTDADAVGWYAVADDRLEPLALETADEHDDADRRVLELDDRTLASLAERDVGVVTEEPSLIPALTRTGIRAERVLTVSLGADGVVLVAGPEPIGVERIERTALAALAGAATLASDRLESSRDLRTCRRGRSRAETAVDRETRLQAIERALLSADAIETLDRRLCDGLLAIEGDGDGSFEVAWVGRIDDRTETVDPVASAGTETDGLGVDSVPIDADAPDPASRVAAREGGPIVVDLERVGGADVDVDVDASDPASVDVARWHRSLRERGLRWAVSVPIDHDGVRYGTLTAYAADSTAVDEPTQRRLRHLATVAGYAVGSLRRTTLADGVTELEVALRDGDPLAAVAAELDRRLDLRAVVPRRSGGTTVYCVIADVDAAALERVVDRVDAVTAARGIGVDAEVANEGGAPDGGDDANDDANDDGSNGSNGAHGDSTAWTDERQRRVGVELRVSTDPITNAVATHGGTVRAVVPDGDRTRLLLEVPTTVSVRSVLQRLEHQYAGVELLARRERERSLQSWQPFETRLQSRLSTRQRRTLEAAYYSGFFEWPRERTGEDVAVALGVSQPTFSRHLRSAQRNLLALLFETESGQG